MAALWDQQIGSLYNVMMKNKFEALSVDDEESERKDKDNLERVVAACIEDPDIPWKKVTHRKENASQNDNTSVCKEVHVRKRLGTFLIQRTIWIVSSQAASSTCGQFGHPKLGTK